MDQQLITDKKTGNKKIKWVDDVPTRTFCFNTDEPIYSDEHFFHFEESVKTILNYISKWCKFNSQWSIPSSGGEAKRWIYEEMRSCFTNNN